MLAPYQRQWHKPTLTVTGSPSVLLGHGMQASSKNINKDGKTNFIKSWLKSWATWDLYIRHWHSLKRGGVFQWEARLCVPSADQRLPRKKEWMVQITVSQIGPLAYFLPNEPCKSLTERKMAYRICCSLCSHINDWDVVKCVFNSTRLKFPNISKHFWCYYWRYWWSDFDIADYMSVLICLIQWIIYFPGHIIHE